MKLTKKNPFEKVELNVDLNLLDKCFDDIKPDPFAKGGYRFRALNRYIYESGEWKPQKVSPLFQSSKVNSLWGDLDRKFMELDFSSAMDELVKIFEIFLDKCDVGYSDVEMGVHPIRTLVRLDHPGHPAPEGVHSDGYMYTSIFVIRRDDGIEGAETFLYEKRDKTGELFSGELKPGEGLLIDDKSIFHYTSPGASKSKENLVRDILAITVSPKNQDPKKEGAFSR